MERVPFLDLKRELEPSRDALKAAAARVIDSGWFILGRELDAFEGEFARFAGRRVCVGVGNGLDALRLVLHARGVGPGDEVIVPALTFIATALAVTQVGATVVLADVDPGTLLLDPAAVARAITPRTRAVVPVHLYGQLCDMASLRALIPSGAFVLEDAAQAHGALRDGASSGEATAAATYSFYPGKNLGALGDGGAVVTDDPALGKQLRRLRNYGQEEKYLHTEQGLNSRLDEIQAALLRVRLERLERDNAARADVVRRYREGLAGVAGLRLLDVPDGSRPAWHIFPVRHPRRDELGRMLREAGIETLVHYPRALHQQPALSHLRDQRHPVSEEAARELLSLPLAPSLTDAEVARVIATTRRACEELAR